MRVSRQAPMRAAMKARIARLEMSLRVQATVVIIIGLVFASMFARMAGSTNEALSTAATVLACTLIIAFLIEARAGARNLFRTDIFMLFALFGLTFVEFLAEQEDLSLSLSLDDACATIDVALCAFGGLALGRHAFRMYSSPASNAQARSLSPPQMFYLFVACAFVGYLHVLLAVNFDIFEAARQMMQPRFTQSWTRSRIGGLSSLINELGLLIYLLPPLAGAVLAEHRRYRAFQKLIIAAILGFTFFYGFAGGTRNIILTYLITFGASYLMMQRRLTFASLAAVGLPLALASVFVVVYLAQIRTFGLQNWATGVERTERLFVDMNLLNVAGLMQAFPSRHDYLGLEIPFNAIVRPIPRFLWPGKPEGLSISIEEVFNVEGMTLSATFIGELWMSGGVFAVILGSLAFGAAAAGWNRVGATAQGNLDQILFASGLFAAGICMRSFLGVMPAVLPTLALYLFRWWYFRRQASLRLRSRKI